MLFPSSIVGFDELHLQFLQRLIANVHRDNSPKQLATVKIIKFIVWPVFLPISFPIRFNIITGIALTITSTPMTLVGISPEMKKRTIVRVIKYNATFTHIKISLTTTVEGL